MGLLLTDNETKVDLLNNEAIAKTIVTLLTEKPDRAVTIGVHGDWGAGKSSVLEMIESALEPNERVLCLKFNGWRFQGFEDAKIALIEGIVTALIEERSLLTKAGDTVAEVLKSIDLLKLARHAGGLAITAFTGVPAAGLIDGVSDFFKGFFSDPGKVINKENYDQVIGSVQSLLKEGGSPSVPVEIATFRKSFSELLKKADIDQLVVLIDDLDRCLPETAIETLEAIRLFVFMENTAFVVAADEAMIEYAVRKHFPDLPDSSGPRDYARNYLEKLIQVPFRIPALGETETRIYVTLLLVGAEVGEDDAGFAKLIAVARELLRQPWKTGGLDAAKVSSALGEKAVAGQNAMPLSDQIGPILASGTQGNPRQIKRFLNALLLRHATAEARGFGAEVLLPPLAKLMLAERFIPTLFDQIASTAAAAPDGRSRDLALLEAYVAAEAYRAKAPRPKDGKGEKADKADKDEEESLTLSEWKGAESIRQWAALSPSIGETDLRPYLFVAKDRKDYFGPASALGRLAAVVDQLMGPRLAVQQYEAELRQLVPAEAAQVFEALRGRIMATGAFDKQPDGVEGVQVLLKAHPGIQKDLVDMLSAIPPEKCGPWVASGWEGYLTDDAIKARFAALLEVWNTKGSPMLRTAAKAALKTRR
jgi:predicted KAP-like P-loop ATPase